MPKAMKTRDVVGTMRRMGCTSRPGKGSHEMWICPCGDHRMPLATGHREVSPGLVGKLTKTFQCLPKGWLQ